MGRRCGGSRCCGIGLWCLLAVSCVRAAGGSEKFDRTCRGAPVRVAFNTSDGPVALQAFPALFGGALPLGVGPPLRLGLADPAHGCNASSDPAQWTHRAVLARRGACSFAEKARAAQAGNATLLILYNDDDSGCFGYLGAGANETGLDDMRTQVVSVSAAAGGKLREMADSGDGRVAAYYKRFSRLDPCELLMALIAVGTLAGGALWAGRDAVAQQRGGGGGGERGAASAELPAQEVTPALAAAFFVAASAVLLLLYLFIDYIGLIMVVLFCLAATQGMTLALGCLLADTFPRLRKQKVRDVPLAYALSFTAAAATAAIWVVFRDRDWAWILQDSLGVTLIMFFIRSIQLPSLKVATLLLVAMFAYDVWWVFLQPLVTDSESVMITVATGGKSQIPIPMLFKVPGWHFAETGAYSMMGYGDVALPGLLAAFARTADLRLRKQSAVAGYFAPAVGGYSVGLMLTYLALLFDWGGDQGQPALLYLVPSMLLPITALAASRGELSTLWQGEFGKQRNSSGEESEQLVAPDDDSDRAEVLPV